MCNPLDYDAGYVILQITQFVETISRCVILLIMHGMYNPADYSSSPMKQTPRNSHSNLENQKISHNYLKKPPIGLTIADIESDERCDRVGMDARYKIMEIHKIAHISFKKPPIGLKVAEMESLELRDNARILILQSKTNFPRIQTRIYPQV